MPIDIFGFTIGKKQPDNAKEPNKQESFVVPDNYDGTYTLETGGVFGTLVDFGGAIKNENKLITQYRNASLFPEVDQAIEDIINESVVMNFDRKPIKLDLENLNISPNIKNKIYKEYDGILRMLDFHNKGHDIFRRWYIDSKIYYHIIVDRDNLEKGIKELRSIDPIKIKKIKKVNKEQKRVGNNTVPFVKNIEEFYVYTNTDKNATVPTPTQGIKIAKDSVCYAHSGVIDYRTNQVVGYLQKAIRPLNMLRQIEDAVVIYRISRAPERRIFYVDVGNLPKNKAEQYLRDIMNRYRNKLTYDSSTGEIKDDRNHLHMLEDFWMPRREGGRGTEITTLDGGQNLGEMEDVNYLLKKLYRSLNVPISRMETESGFNMGRSAEITRDEVKFFKFIEKIRMRFCDIFTQLLKVQLLLKGVMSEKDWNLISPDIRFSFNHDSYFSELKETEILKERLDVMTQMDEYVGKYYSTEWIRKNVLRQSEEDITIIDNQMKKEAEMTSGDPEETQEGEY
jgi:nitrite reductase/ring-hydroxylating ferredoxin subunit